MRKKRLKMFRFLTTAFLFGSSIFTPFTSLAANNCEEWYAKAGLIDKAGNNEEGYTIGSRGDSGYSLARLDNQFDILTTEIQFSFNAYPTDGTSTEIWAYMSFGLDFDEKTILHTTDENKESGLIELILWQRAGGEFNLSLFNDYEHAIIAIENFDFDAVHTISFAEKSVGTYLIFDGMPYTTVDFSSALEKHTGDYAGSTYLGIGGIQGYEFSNLKLVPIEKTETPEVEAPNTSSGGSKLGDIDISDEPVDSKPETEITNNNEFQFFPLVVILAGIAVVIIIFIIIIIRVSKHKKKPSDINNKN